MYDFLSAVVVVAESSSNRLAVAQNPKTHTQPMNCDQISLKTPPSLLLLTEFLNSLHRLIFPVLFRVYTILYVVVVVESS